MSANNVYAKARKTLLEYAYLAHVWDGKVSTENGGFRRSYEASMHDIDGGYHMTNLTDIIFRYLQRPSLHQYDTYDIKQKVSRFTGLVRNPKDIPIEFIHMLRRYMANDNVQHLMKRLSMEEISKANPGFDAIIFAAKALLLIYKSKVNKAIQTMIYVKDHILKV